jgi:1-phosphofructokinase family hexose kinase
MAGSYGRILEDLYRQNGIQSELIWVAGEIRTVTVIVETGRRCLTQISHPGYHVDPQDCHRFLLAVEQTAAGAAWGVAAGSLPPGAPVEFYRQVCEVAHRAGAKMLIDCSGKPLLAALPCGPKIVKLNSSEYQDTFEVPVHPIDSLVGHARSLIDEYGLEAVVVTLGMEGILLVLADGALHARGPQLQPVNPAGAGDAASAALVYRLSLGETWADALRWACAAGAAVVQTEATADCSLDVVQSLLPQVQVRLVDEVSVNF